MEFFIPNPPEPDDPSDEWKKEQEVNGHADQLLPVDPNFDCKLSPPPPPADFGTHLPSTLETLHVSGALADATCKRFTELGFTTEHIKDPRLFAKLFFHEHECLLIERYPKGHVCCPLIKGHRFLHRKQHPKS